MSLPLKGNDDVWQSKTVIKRFLADGRLSGSLSQFKVNRPFLADNAAFVPVVIVMFTLHRVRRCNYGCPIWARSGSYSHRALGTNSYSSA